MYEGIVLSELIPGGRKAGQILLNSSSLSFEKDDLEVKFPIEGLQISHGGAGKRLLYFTHASMPGYTIQTDALSILKNPVLANLTSARSSVKSVQRHKLTLGAWLGYTGILIAIVVGAFFVFRGNIIKMVAMSVPMGYQEKIGKPLFESTLKANKVLKSDSLDKYISELTEPLLAQVKDTSYHFKFAVIENEEINAFALPGGYVVIHSGLLEKADSPDEVAGVLSHEISHVTHRHHLRGLFNSMGTFYVLGAFFGDISIIGSVIDIGASLESLNFSREFETESDLEGLKLALAAGYTSEGFVRFFEKLKEEHGQGNAMLAYVSTHPGADNRIESIKKEATKLSENSNKPSFFINYTIFKKHLHTLFKD